MSMLVCGNTAAMLQDTRFGTHFVVQGDRSQHFGPFACALGSEKALQSEGSGGDCC